MFVRPARTLAALILPLALVVAACGSDKKSPTVSDQASSKNSIGNSAGTAKAPTAQAPSPPAAPTVAAITTDDGNHYTVTVTPKAPDSKAACGGVNNVGHLIVPFTLSVKNDATTQVPQPGLGL